MTDYTRLESVGYDATFEMNEFNEPRIRSEIETIKDALLFILFSAPGQYPSLPQIGMDISNLLYERFDDIDPNQLKETVIQQCNALRIYFDQSIINFKKVKYKGQPSLLIHISGHESYPDGYMRDHIKKVDNYLIGITYDELNRMVYNVTSNWT